MTLQTLGDAALEKGMVVTTDEHGTTKDVFPQETFFDEATGKEMYQEVTW